MKSFIKYGLWTGTISGLWGIGCFTIVGWMNTAFFHQSIPATEIRSYSGLFSILILVVGIYLGMREVKRKNDDALSYGVAVKTGIIISLITGVVVCLFTLLYCNVINPGYADFMVKDTGKALAAAGKAPEEISRRLEGVRKEFTTGAQMMMALVGQTVVGSIVSLILGLFIRSKK